VDGTAGTAKAIAAGFSHSCAIQAGTDAVVCWGADSWDQATPPPSVDGTAGTAAAIATGGSHSCALQAGTGVVVCWGRDVYGETSPPPSVDGTAGTATAIAAGDHYSCAIQGGTDAVVCWGAPIDADAIPPPSVDGTRGTAIAIAAGSRRMLAIRTPECSDGLDNDGDGLVDDPDDPGCDDAGDWFETSPLLVCDDGLDNDGDQLFDFPADPECEDLLDGSEAPDAGQARVSLKIQLKFNRISKDAIQLKIRHWMLPAGVVPTDVTVDVGGAVLTGTLDAKGRFKSQDRRDSIAMRQSRKTRLWALTVNRRSNDFAADLADEGLTDADNPKPGLPVTVPLTIEMGGASYSWEVDLVYRSKLGRKGNAK
jgi:hypothetical protein